jgi:hypothetical protein
MSLNEKLQGWITTAQVYAKFIAAISGVVLTAVAQLLPVDIRSTATIIVGLIAAFAVKEFSNLDSERSA